MKIFSFRRSSGRALPYGYIYISELSCARAHFLALALSGHTHKTKPFRFQTKIAPCNLAHYNTQPLPRIVLEEHFTQAKSSPPFTKQQQPKTSIPSVAAMALFINIEVT